MDDRQTQSDKSRKILREMERKSQDTIRVHNITDKDYSCVYDLREWLIPNKDRDLGYGKGNLDVPRYVAKHYVKHMIDKLITESSDKELEKQKLAAEKKGEFWPTTELRVAKRTSNPELRKMYMSQLWLGVVREFAVNDAPLIAQQEVKKKDNRSLDEQLLDEMGERFINSEEVEEAPLYVSKKDREVKNEEDKVKDDFANSIA